MRYIIFIALAGLPVSFVLADTPAVATLLNEYAAQGASKPDAEQGKRLWFKKFKAKGRFPERSCTTCHTGRLQQAGKHARTNKRIDPMAPSVNLERLKSTKEIRKWFKRNCKWTLGRECTATEKADLLAFIKNQ